MELERSKSQKVVLVFGVFDGCHKGHEYFLQQAAQYGEKLIVSVAHDEIVQKFKNRTPKYSLEERIEAIIKLNIADNVIAGDKIINTWHIIDTYQPEIIVVGHDQEKLRQALIELSKTKTCIKRIIQIDAFERDKYKSTLLN